MNWNYINWYWFVSILLYKVIRFLLLIVITTKPIGFSMKKLHVGPRMVFSIVHLNINWNGFKPFLPLSYLTLWIQCPLMLRRSSKLWYIVTHLRINLPHTGEAMTLYRQSFLVLGIPLFYSNYLCRTPDIAAVGTIFNVLTHC